MPFFSLINNFLKACDPRYIAKFPTKFLCKYYPSQSAHILTKTLQPSTQIATQKTQNFRKRRQTNGPPARRPETFDRSTYCPVDICLRARMMDAFIYF